MEYKKLAENIASQINVYNYEVENLIDDLRKCKIGLENNNIDDIICDMEINLGKIKELVGQLKDFYKEDENETEN